MLFYFSKLDTISPYLYLIIQSPLYSTEPSFKYLAVSPVLYIFFPLINGFSINFSSVSSGLFRYPLEIPSPDIYISPVAFAGTTFKSPSICKSVHYQQACLLVRICLYPFPIVFMYHAAYRNLRRTVFIIYFYILTETFADFLCQACF